MTSINTIYNHTTKIVFSFQHFYIDSGCGKIGAWFLEPEVSAKNANEDKVILYLHGVKGTRGRAHRVELYNVLLGEGFRILTIDYRYQML